MGPVTTGDRTATRDEVLAHRAELRRLAVVHDLTDSRIDPLGTVIVHSDTPGYAAVRHFATDATELIGAWVNVIVDNVPAADTSTEPL